jgi:dihydrodipicolinate synthase/N-acetylneuraminate lyase
MMWRLGLLDVPEVRLPLVPVDDANAAALDGVLDRAGLFEKV